MKKVIECIKKKIEIIISQSSVPEDFIHSRNTVKWLLYLEPDADENLKIAAFGHDIERAIENRKVERKNYRTYDEFKKMHSLNSAKILREIMEECGAGDDMIKDVYNLVLLHETGGNKRADLLNQADALSFFETNLPLFARRHSIEEVRKRCEWGFKRLSDTSKQILKEFRYKDSKLNKIIESLFNK